MNVKYIFSEENEVGYDIPVVVISELIANKTLTLIDRKDIEQIWVYEDKTMDDISVRARIRKTISVGKSADTAEYEFCTKYYLTKKSRIELSASALTADEYKILKHLYRNCEAVNKRRLVLRDKDTPYIYEVDIYQDNPVARIEVEFNSAQDMKTFEPPAWLSKRRKS